MERLLYGYFRSSAAYRVRIALNLKGLAVQHVPVHLLRGGGEQLSEGYRARNPQALVPLLAEDDWQLSQSLAIVEYLDETHPQPSLLPGDARQRARIRQVALAVACDVHPLNNLRVLKYLKHSLGVDDAAKDTWVRHWIDLGLRALEDMLAPEGAGARFCVGATPTLADVCLVPQLFNARRFDVDVDGAYPTLAAIERTCAALPVFADAHPSRQPDAE